MLSDDCKAYCSHKCSPHNEDNRAHLGRHICCACYDLLTTDPATLRRDMEIRRAAFRRMGHIAEEINAASARQIHLLAQMADKAWPEVEDYCNPSITLDTSDEEEESARLSARAALAASQKVTAVGRSLLDATEMGRAERPDNSHTLLQSFAIEVPVSSLVMKTTGPENVVSEQRFRGHTEPS